MKLLCWNVNGLRSAHRKGLAQLVGAAEPNILCVQETKISRDLIEGANLSLDGYRALFSSAKQRGYSGVATYVKRDYEVDLENGQPTIGIERADREGRFLITTHQYFQLYNVYFPSGTTGETRQNFKYRFLDEFYDHLQALPKKVRDKLIICGDFNICHKDIDIHHPAQAEKLGLSGFLPDERKWLDRFVKLGFIDTFRFIHGDITGQYTWWTFRAGARKRNLGWRIDYIFISKALGSKIRDARILDSVTGSDHCPILVEMDL